MFILISPSKTLATTPPATTYRTTKPLLLHRATELGDRLRDCSIDQLEKLFRISPQLARQCYRWYQEWTPAPARSAKVPALFLYRGDVYEGIDADSWTKSDMAFAQTQLRILSGLYGLLRPLDAICRYRLEMGTRFLETPLTLYDFWGNDIKDALYERARGAMIVNLASQEYFRATLGQPTAGGLSKTNRVIAPAFREEERGQFKMLSFYAKRARGLMVRHLIENRISDLAGLCEFSAEGYRFNERLSSADAPVFTRPKPASRSRQMSAGQIV